MRRVVLVSMIGSLLFATPVFASTSTAEFVPVENEFAAAIVTRADGKILYSFKPDKSHTAASLSKLVLAVTMLDKKWNWNTVVKMSSADEVGGGRLRVATGSKIKLTDLWQSALGSSANNAAMAMARLAGPGVSAFMKKANAKVKSLGATSSAFYDPAGMNPKNKTTARDMALIARAAFADPLVSKASQNGPYTFALAGTSLTHTIKNTNAPLLDDPDVYLQGGKTGYLPESLYNYAAELRPMKSDGTGDQKKSVIVVVLGAPSTANALASAKRMAEWAWEEDDRFKGSQYPIPTRVLVLGMNGNDVRWVQEQLKVSPTSGQFGPLTLAAVRAFQQAHGIAKSGNTGYGVVGPATRAKLVELAP